MLALKFKCRILILGFARFSRIDALVPLFLAAPFKRLVAVREFAALKCTVAVPA